MRRVYGSIAVLSFAVLHGQVLPVSRGAIRMGHVHIISADPAGEKRFWTEGLGAQFVKTDAFDLYKIPGVLIVVQKGDEREGTVGSIVNHIAMLVKDLKGTVEKCKAAGAAVVSQNEQQAMLTGPDHVRVELTGDASLETEAANHHIHFYTQDPAKMQQWYVDVFHAVAGKRGRFIAADLPGVNLTFAPSDAALAGTRGRSLDHIGFEVHDLEAYTKRLQEAGVTLTVPYREVPSLGIAIAFVTDPWGTYIELTEGLDKIQ